MESNPPPPPTRFGTANKLWLGGNMNTVEAEDGSARRSFQLKKAPRRNTCTAVASRLPGNEANGGRNVFSGLAAAMGFNGERPVGTGRRTSVDPAGTSPSAGNRNSDPGRRRRSLGATLKPSGLSGGAGSCGGGKRTDDVCARLERLVQKLEEGSAGLGEEQLRTLLLEHQRSLEAQQHTQATQLREELRSLADVQRQQASSISSIVSTLSNLEARVGGGGGSGGGISLGTRDAHQLHEKMESGKEVAQLLQENHALEAMVERVRKEQARE